MIDPNLYIGAALLVIGYGAGRIHLLNKTKQVLVKAVCACSHSLAHHNQETNKCHGQKLQKNSRTKNGDWIGDQWVTCTCQHYVGERPIENFFTTPAIFSDDDK